MKVTNEVALFLRGARLQRRVIGALIIRELHSRFGRLYFGYIWLFFEPLLLGSAIGLVHVLSDHSALYGPFEFWTVGCILYFFFPGRISLAPVAIPPNIVYLPCD